MKKQELIHLHGLLAEVSTYVEHQEGESLDLDEYDSLGVKPTSIHKSKTNHKAAVCTLASSITRNIDSETETVTATAD